MKIKGASLSSAIRNPHLEGLEMRIAGAIEAYERDHPQSIVSTIRVSHPKQAGAGPRYVAVSIDVVTIPP
jgi:hypothetical protein